MRDDLPEAVHTVLRRWHSGQQEALPWGEMLTVAQHLAESPLPNPDLSGKVVVLEALVSLVGEAGEDAARIIRLRFVDGLTAAATARELNLSQDVVYKRQRVAIQVIAAPWREDVALRVAHALETQGVVGTTRPRGG